MDGQRLDAIAKGLGGATGRRLALRGLAAAALGLGLTQLGNEEAAAVCRPVRGSGRCNSRQMCRHGYQCCSGRCRNTARDPGHCGGCARSNRCKTTLGQRCRSGRCVCPDRRPPCGGGRCCAAGTACQRNPFDVSGSSCLPICGDGRLPCGPTCCTATQACQHDASPASFGGVCAEAAVCPAACEDGRFPCGMGEDASCCGPNQACGLNADDTPVCEPPVP